MSDIKRGRLREVSVRPMYDEKGKVTGHTVSAHHERGEEAKKGENSWESPRPIETPHETQASAMEAVKEHLKDNEEKHGGSKRGRSMKDAIGG